MASNRLQTEANAKATALNKVPEHARSSALKKVPELNEATAPNEFHEIPASAELAPRIERPLSPGMAALATSKPSALDVSPRLHASLKRLAANVYRRGDKGWETPDDSNVASQDVTDLKLRNLVEIERAGGQECVAVTELGRDIVDMVRRGRAGSAA